MELTTSESTSNPRPPQIACIGAGYWGKNLVRNFQSLGALGWVCEPDSSRQAELMQVDHTLRITDRLEDVLEDPKVAGVAIATPAATHGELVLRALKAGGRLCGKAIVSVRSRGGEAGCFCNGSLAYSDGGSSALVSSSYY